MQISDGAVQTSGATITVRGQGGAEGTGGGTTAYGASGIVYYTPTQAETNFTSFVVIASKTGCIPVAQTIVTTASATPGHVVVGSNTDKTGYSLTVGTGLGDQTADITGNLSGSVGSLTGYVAPPTAAAIRAEIDANSTKLDATVSSRLAAASYTAPDNAGIATVQAKTDQLAFTVAGQVDANTVSMNDAAVLGTGTSGDKWRGA